MNRAAVPKRDWMRSCGNCVLFHFTRHCCQCRRMAARGGDECPPRVPQRRAQRVHRPGPLAGTILADVPQLPGRAHGPSHGFGHHSHQYGRKGMDSGASFQRGEARHARPAFPRLPGQAVRLHGHVVLRRHGTASIRLHAEQASGLRRLVGGRKEVAQPDHAGRNLRPLHLASEHVSTAKPICAGGATGSLT